MSSAERRDCSEVVLELPWLASGALDADRRRDLESHLERCPACRAEAERCRAERAQLRAEAAPAAAPHPAQLARLLERLDDAPEEAEDDGALRPAPAPRPRRRRLWSRTPPVARWLIAAQLVALAGLGLYAARPEPAPPDPRFRALSAPAAAPARGVVRVVFTASASEAEIRALLLSVRAEIVGGPSAVGAYTLALDGAGAAEPVDVVLGLLRADARVRLAEPVVGRDAPPR